MRPGPLLSNAQTAAAWLVVLALLIAWELA